MDERYSVAGGIGCTGGSSSSSSIVIIVQPTQIENLSLIPSGLDLAGAEVELVGIVQRERKLSAALALAGQ